MAFSRRRRKKREVAHLEVSLTPLIDVVLTLLIIFMVTTPMIQNSIKIDLPKGQAREGGTDQPELIVAIDKEQNMYFNNQPMTLKTLGPAIKKLLAERYKGQERRVWVKVDEAVPTKCLISTIDCIKVVGGIKDVAIATEAHRTA